MTKLYRHRKRQLSTRILNRPRNRKLTLGDVDMKTAAPPPDADNVYVLDPGEDVADINMNVMDMDTFRATYNGIPGTFTCANATDECADYCHYGEYRHRRSNESSRILLLLTGGHLNPTTMSNQRRRKTPTICILGIGCSHRIPTMRRRITRSLPSSAALLLRISSLWD